MKKIILSTLMLLLLVPALAFAQLLGGGQVLLLDIPEDDEIVDGATFSLVGKANSSYACSISIDGLTPSDYSLSATITSPSGQAVSTNRAASEKDAIRYFNLFNYSRSGTSDRNDLVFFTAPNGADEFGKYSLSIGISNDLEEPDYLRLSCVETTVKCNFNTVVNEFNFMEITSFGPVTGVAQITTVNFDGTSNTSAPAVLRAGLRTDLDIHSLSGASTFGSVYLQPLNYMPNIDGFAAPKVSTYKDGELTSSLSCGNSFTPFLFGLR